MKRTGFYFAVNTSADQNPSLSVGILELGLLHDREYHLRLSHPSGGRVRDSLVFNRRESAQTSLPAPSVTSPARST